MSNITVFNNEAFGALRTIKKDGEIWFIASDVARALGYSRPADAVSQHCRYTAKHSIPHPQGKGTLEVNIIPEGDLYRLIIRSKLPAAEQFERWVFDEVLPSIRKTGKYEIPKQPVDKDLELQKLAVETMKVRTEQSKLLLSIADTVSNELYKETLKSVAVATLTGKEYLPLPKIECNYHTTTDLANILSKKFNRKVSANIVGRLTTKNNLKTEEYAVKVWDKARFSNKQIESYRYKDSVIEPLCKAYELYLQIHS